MEASSLLQRQAKLGHTRHAQEDRVNLLLHVDLSAPRASSESLLAAPPAFHVLRFWCPSCVPSLTGSWG